MNYGLYNEFDGYVGFWINGIPYDSANKPFPEGFRKYRYVNSVSKELKKSECDQEILKYFESDTKKEYLGNRLMNGRHYYYRAKSNKRKIIAKTRVIYPVRSESICRELGPFNNVTFHLASLICAQFGSTKRNWPELFDLLDRCGITSDCYVCTQIGHKIANSLIRIASLRIFAEPEQSILELPVNSVDSYNPESRIGKFGMGFFSFLYWVVGHPLRTLHIYSWFKDDQKGYCGYHATIKDNTDGSGLMLNLQILNTAVTTTGTYIYLDCSKERLLSGTIIRFRNQVSKLSYIRNAVINTEISTRHFDMPITEFFGERILNRDYVTPDMTNSVFLVIIPDKITIEDYAHGIPINVLLGSLFVPSISTKTIRSNSVIPKGWSPNNRLIDDQYFNITVGDVVVFNGGTYDPDDLPHDLAIKYFFGAVIDMPSTTRLPVSRDDIILDDVTEPYFYNGIISVLELAKKRGSIVPIQNGIDEYLRYTSSSRNREVVLKALSEFYDANKYLLIGPSAYNNLRTMFPGLIKSNRTFIHELEDYLIKNIPHRSNVWWGKFVVTIDRKMPHAIATYNFPKLVFVTSEYQEKDNWITNGALSFPDLNLAPIDTKFGAKKHAQYTELLKKHVGIVNDLYLNLMTRYDGLSVYYRLKSPYAVEYEKLSPLESLAESISQLRSIFTESEVNEIIYALINKINTLVGSRSGELKQPELRLVLPFSAVNDSSFEYMHLVKSSEKLRRLRVEMTIATINACSGVKNENNIFFILGAHPDRFMGWYGEFNDLMMIVDRAEDFIQYSIFVSSFRDAKFRISDENGGKSVKPDMDILSRFMLDKIRDLKPDINSIDSILENGIVDAKWLKIVDEIYGWLKYLFSSSHQFDSTYSVPKGGTTFLASRLIGYLFENEPTDIMETFEAASSYNKTLELQMIEIAVNEGTTKPFVPAVLTELTQNSFDAIRMSGGQNRTIEIEYQINEDCFEILVKDYIGIPPTGLLYMGVPFLSTKSNNELATGEMGSGFFNVYRESQLVVINTVFDGYQYTFYDYPIRSGDRVIDIERTVIRNKSKAKPGTQIFARSLPTNMEKLSGYMGDARYTSLRVLQQITAFDNVIIFVNNELHITQKTHILSQGYFDVYMVDDTNISYVFTNGIPFAPLSNYYGSDFPLDVRTAMGYGFIINIRHGGYTPVQTRTRINMPEEDLNVFEDILMFCVLVKGMYLVINKEGLWGWIYTNYRSSAEANQLRENVLTVEERRQRVDANFRSYMMSIDVYRWNRSAGRHNPGYNLAHLTNKMIDHAGNRYMDIPENYEYMVKFANTLELPDLPEVKTMIKTILLRWIKRKSHMPLGQKHNLASGKAYAPSDIKYPKDIPVPELEPYFRIWIELYALICQEIGIVGWTDLTITEVKVIKSEMRRGAVAWQSGSKTYINVVNYHQKQIQDFIKAVKRVKEPSDFTLIKDTIWKEYMSYKYRASACPHEIEHARRNTDHTSEDSHQEITIAMWDGDIPHERTFDQSINDVFRKVIEAGFYIRLFDQYKRAKLL